jgi:uncharacterized membrane protein
MTALLSQRVQVVALDTAPSRRWEYLLYVAMLSFVVTLATYSVMRHQNLWSDMYDLGQEVQVHWNTAHLRWFESSVEVPNNLGDHVTFVDILTAVPYRLFPSPLTLLILQPLIYALGAIAVFRIGRRLLRCEMLAFLAALAYLAQPAAGFAIGYDYHPMVYAAPLALFCFDALLRGQRWWAWMLFILLCACREDAGMTAAAVGVLGWFAKKHRRTAVAMAVLGMAWFVIAMFFILPAMRGGPSDSIEKFAFFGSTSGEVLRNIITRPDMVWARLMEDTRRVTFIPMLSTPWLGASLLTIGGWLSILLTTALGILSESPTKFAIGYSQPYVVLPIITIAGIMGLRRLIKWIPPLDEPRGKIALASIWLFVIVAANAHRNVIIENRWQMSRNPLRDELVKLAPLIPDDAALSATSKLGPHFAQRPQIAIYPITQWMPRAFPNTDRRHAQFVLIQTTQARLPKDALEPDPVFYRLAAQTKTLRLYRLREAVAAAD